MVLMVRWGEIIERGKTRKAFIFVHVQYLLREKKWKWSANSPSQIVYKIRANFFIIKICVTTTQVCSVNEEGETSIV